MLIDVRKVEGGQWTIKHSHYRFTKEVHVCINILEFIFCCHQFEVWKIYYQPYLLIDIKPVLENLKSEIEHKDEIDRCCTLIFDEIGLSTGYYYESNKQRICGYEDLGLHRNNIEANHAFVFMISGISKNYKQVVA